MLPHISDPFQGISPGLTDGAVWKAFGLVFNDMNLKFSVLSVDPLTLAASGDPSFELYAAGIASDRYPDQAKLLVVRLIQACIARYTDARFRRRFGRGPVLGDTSSGDPMSSLSGILAAVQATVRNDLSNAFSAPASAEICTVLPGMTDAVAPPTEAMLHKAIKYVFGEGQMRWTVVSTETGASIDPCYKFTKARADSNAEHPADRARAAVVRVVDELVISSRPEIVEAISSGKLSKAILRKHVEMLLDEDIIVLLFFQGDDLYGDDFEQDDGYSDSVSGLADLLAEGRLLMASTL